MIIESDTALALLGTTNTFPLPPDWERQPVVQGCLRSVQVDPDIPVVAQVRFDGKDPGTFYTPCTLPEGIYGGIPFSNKSQQILELKPLTADLDIEVWRLAHKLEEETEAATGEDYFKSEGPIPDGYVMAKEALDSRINQRNRVAVGAIPELVSELGRIGHPLDDVFDVSFFTNARFS